MDDVPTGFCEVDLLLVPGPVAFAARVVVRLLIWVHSSPLVQHSFRTALRAAARPRSYSIALVSVSVTSRHVSRTTSKDKKWAAKRIV